MIPKLIHQIWLGDKLMHPLMIEWRERWQELHPGWTVLLWEESECPSCLKTDWKGGTVVTPSPQQRELLAKSCHLSQRSNIWRYLIIWWFGGLYADIDVEPFKPVDDLVDGLDAFAARRHSVLDTYECAFFGAIPKHPWLNHLVEGLPDCDPSVTLTMGVDYFTGVARQHPEVTILSKESVIFQVPGDWTEAKKAAKVPEVGVDREPVPADAFAKHHWSSIWFPRGFESLL